MIQPVVTWLLLKVANKSIAEIRNIGPATERAIVLPSAL